MRSTTSWFSRRLSNSLRSVDQSVREREANQLGARAHTELVVDSRAMSLNRSVRDEQSSGDLGRGVTEGDESKHLELACGELGRGLTSGSTASSAPS
jgi:hypothetical protein